MIKYIRDLRPAKRGLTINLHCKNPEPLMSALGQKLTLKRLHPMSALPPKADMVRHNHDVRFVPKADIPRCRKNVAIRSPRRRGRAAIAALAFVAIEEASGRMIGVVRLHAESSRESREFAVTVRSDFQGHGLGRMLMELIIEYARSLGLRFIDGRVLHENKAMLKLCRELGFVLLMDPEDAGVTIVRLSLI